MTTYKDFLLFEHESGELMFMRRSSIKSMHPKYQHGRGYLIFASDGAVSQPVYKTNTIQEAKAWCEAQIKMIEAGNVLEETKTTK